MNETPETGLSQIKTREEARELAVKMVKGGASFADASKALAERGWVGPRTSKPLGPAEISRLVTPFHRQVRPHKKRQPKRVAAQTKAAPKGAGKDRLGAVKSILSLKMDAEERIALALLVLS